MNRPRNISFGHMPRLSKTSSPVITFIFVNNHSTDSANGTKLGDIPFVIWVWIRPAMLQLVFSDFAHGKFNTAGFREAIREFQRRHMLTMAVRTKSDSSLIIEMQLSLILKLTKLRAVTNHVLIPTKVAEERRAQT